MTKTLLASAAGLAATAAVLATPAQAAEFTLDTQPTLAAVAAMDWNHSDRDDWDDDDWDDDDDDDDRKWRKRRYRDDRYGRGYYDEPVYRDTRVWRGRDGRVYCRKRDGTVGLIVGGALGAIIGREIDTRGDRSVGTILGAAGGAILGREVARGRCR